MHRFVQRLFTGLFGLWCALSACAIAGFTLERVGDRYSLRAEQAPLPEILAEIDRRETAALRFYGSHDRLVSATYHDLTLDALLYRLGVSYVLVYERDDEGEFRLGDAVVLDSDATAIEPRAADAARRLVRDLRNDDIPGNAHRAQYKLMELGCDAVPFLEEALYDGDYQGRQLAASVLRYVCPDYVASDRLLDISLELLNRTNYDDGQYWSLFSPSEAFFFLQDTSRYPRVRSRILSNLQSREPQERLLSALLAAERGETAYAETLVRILAPHLADNDLKSDAAAASRALQSLGPSVLPFLERYRNAPDAQQAELADLIIRAIQTGAMPRFKPVMYAGYGHPLEEPAWVNALRWYDYKFPDDSGTYHELAEPRWTTKDYYGSMEYPGSE